MVKRKTYKQENQKIYKEDLIVITKDSEIPILLFKIDQHAFDVLARSNEIVLVIGAAAGILQFIEGTDFDTIGFFRNRSDFEDAENRVIAFIYDLENLGAGTLASALDLFLDVAGHGITPSES